MAEKDATPKDATPSEQQVWTPPSQQPPPQYPAVKPGEPVDVNVPDPLRMDLSKAKEPKQSNVAGSSKEGRRP